MKNQNTMFTAILFVLLCLALLSRAQAVLPPPDGGYPNENTAEGEDALFSLTNGFQNTAVGHQALFSNTFGFWNTAVGYHALFSNTSVGLNTAIGAFALENNTEGAFNTAIGFKALVSNTTGVWNTALGYQTLFDNTTGEQNTAVGMQALISNTSGHANTATGAFALIHNTTGFDNTATGDSALHSNTTGSNNTASGSAALLNTTGNFNTANGSKALQNNTLGSFNTAAGFSALFNSTGSGNLGLGVNAGANVITASNVIVIGTAGRNVSNSCFIGNIRGVRTAINNAIPVVIDSAGQLGTMSSSRRFKKDVKPMDKASEAILALKPVTFRYKGGPAGAGPQFGLIAEDVAEVNPDLVVRDDNGEIYTVRYDAVNAMLLNEFLKEHRKVEVQARKIEEQKATISELKKGMETVVTRLKEQDSRIQKVSDQVEVRNPAAQMVLNKQ